MPRRGLSRGVRLASLPIGLAGRAAVGLGKRIGGRSAELVNAEIQAATAEQLFRVLGELKGGAMKLGQALSVFEAALPEEYAAPYRQTLTRLQESAPPLPTATLVAVLVEQMGPDWADQFSEFDPHPAAAASIGQVHRAVWYDGRPVAVKIQYPGAGQALRSDLTQLARISRLFGLLVPGLDIGPILEELRDRLSEELDYELEAQYQHRYARAFRRTRDFHVPDVVAATPRVLVTEWMDGRPLADVIANGTPAERNRAGLLLTRFLFSSPSRAGLLHADPHPGNFRILADDRLGVLDFGAVDRLPDGIPTPIGPLLRAALDGDAQTLYDGLRAEGFVRPGVRLDAASLLDFLNPILEPAREREFQFTRAWLRTHASVMGDPRSSGYPIGRQLNLPPEYLMIYRVTTGTIALLCQLEARAPFRAELARWLPGFTLSTTTRAPNPGPRGSRAPTRRSGRA